MGDSATATTRASGWMRIEGPGGQSASVYALEGDEVTISFEPDVEGEGDG